MILKIGGDCKPPRIQTVELQSTKRAASVGGTPPELAGTTQKNPQVPLCYTCGSAISLLAVFP